MLLFFVTCFSFILFYRYSLPIKPLPPWASEMRLLSFYFWKDLSIFFPCAKSLNKSLSVALNPKVVSAKANKKNIASSASSAENLETAKTQGQQMSVLDLPELALECILERLQPDALCSMACVCTYLRDMCLGDHLWEEHMKQRWGRVIGSAAYREWRWHVASRKESNSYFLDGGKGRGFLMGYLSKLWPVLLLRSSFNSDRISYGINIDSKKMKREIKQPSVDSIVSCYRALETGKFWFPAQVFNRENGHVGFMLSCYDAELSYDSRTDTFQARYPPHGRRAVAIETGVTWDRLRAPPVDTSPHELYISDCLNDLHPRDHIEIQWRRNKQFPYGWWFGVVGHLETCDGNESYCRCHESDTVVLEFNQYAPGSRWRHTMINRKDHREEGNEADGFYGGIRKLYSKVETAMWQQFWPAETLE